MRRVRAYIGLGANLGDAAATLAGGGPRARGPAGRPAPRASPGSTPPPRSASPTSREFRNAVVALDVPAGAGSGDGRRRPARRAQAARAGVRPPGARALGPARARSRPPRVRARAARDRPARRTACSLDPGKADRLLVVPHREAADRLFVLAPLADLAPGLVPPGWTETVATAAARRRDRGPGRRPADRDLGRRRARGS